MIWCVEDDACIRDIEVYALTSTGFEAKGFEDGDSFWKALQFEKPELMVLDVMLPGVDGVTLLKRMKAAKELQDIPVIMATAKGSEYDKIQSLDLGADDYLVQPFGIMEMVNRSNDLRQALNEALDHGHGSVIREFDGRIYRFDMSSICSDGKLLGAVILAVDVTEEHNAEKLRREFSANVSHELKTPLQGIIGSAELLESGMVKPEDRPRFVGHIRREASRLVNLIEDIIRLSQLDEGAAMLTETVDILQLSEEVKSLLQPSAEDRNVTVNLSGGGFAVVGVRRMLHEVIYNLCDNAIKYNVLGGRVLIHAEEGRLTVSDTGIGIPPEHQDRIFERFYRVDKSHSKATGGTGLGLSIVKHAVQHHHGKIVLESEPDKGTTISVLFDASV